jgi:serine/threonine protein kinase
MAFTAGDTVGEYTITRILGAGGLGAVYEARHHISQRLEAIKVLLPEQTGTPEMQERFRREIQLLASLNHPHIAGLHNAFFFDQQLVMVMELVEGEDLRATSRRTRIALPTLLDYTAQVLSALDYAHARGVVHRDIKPANIMVAPGGIAKVLDFGIALTARSTELTAAGALIGSPTHMAPEQMRGEKATPQSDIYSLGVTLYELIAGQPPVTGATTYELMMAHLYIVPIPLRTLRPDIAPALSEIVAKALEKDPALRFPTAADFLTVLRHELHAAEANTTQTPAQSWQRISTDQLTQPSPGQPHAPSHAHLPTQTPTHTPALTQSEPLPLDTIIRHLAAFIGPIAKIVVNRLARQHTDLDTLYTEAAKQIDTEADRQRFLQTRPR